MTLNTRGRGMLSHTDAIDRGAYWQGASEDVIRGCAIATFGEPNLKLSNGAEMRFGSHGSTAVALCGDKRGSWFDHEKQEGGFLLIPAEDFGRDAPRHDGTFRLGAKASEPQDNGNRAKARTLWDASAPIAGTLAAAFLLLPALGLWGAILVGAAINVIVFVVAALLAKSVGTESSRSSGPRSIFAWRPESWILPLMLISGFATFAYEVLRTRLLSHILGGSVVAFATMLASFLSGIVIGSALASRFATTQATAQVEFIVSEIGIAVMCVAIYLTLDQFIPPTAGLLGNVTIAIALLLPATLFIGATFPFAVRILCADESEASVLSARVYAWNTVGAVVGAVVAGFILIPMLKYEGSQGDGYH